MTGRPTITDDRVKRRLLAMLGPTGAAFGSELAAEEWELLSHIAEQHRLEPLLHHNAGLAAGAIAVPVAVLDRWRAAYRQSAVTALALHSGLGRIAAVLDEAGIAYAALKGAWLAWHAYPNAALRPMRDLDILVEAADVVRGFELLLSAGLQRATSDPTPIAYALDNNKHLPMLYDPGSGSYVELHCRLIDRRAQFSGTPLETASVLAQRKRQAQSGATIAYPAITTTLLHLIVHSAYDHRFSNGPLILTDIAMIAERQDVDWDWFWDAAQRGGWERGCRLLLRLAQEYCADATVEWNLGDGREIPAEVCNNAALMMLQDTDLRPDLAVQVSLTESGPGGLLSVALGRLLVPAHVVAAFAGLQKPGKWVWVLYPLWLVAKAGRTLGGLFSRRQRREVARAMAVDRWLGAAEGV